MPENGQDKQNQFFLGSKKLGLNLLPPLTFILISVDMETNVRSCNDLPWRRTQHPTFPCLPRNLVFASDATGIRGHLWSGLKFFVHTNVGLPFAATLMLGRKAAALFTCTAKWWVPALAVRPSLCYLLTALSSWDQPCSFNCFQASVFEGLTDTFCYGSCFLCFLLSFCP